MVEQLLPNIAGSFQQGFQNGQTMQANRLLGAGLNGDPNALAQAGMIDPGAVMQVKQFQAAQQASQQQTQQAQQAQQMQKIGGAARYMLGALQTKDPNQIEGAYQAVRPYLAELGQAQGKVPPANWDPSMTQAIYQAAAMTSQAFPEDNKLQVVAPGSTLLRGTSPVYSSPDKPTVDAANGVTISNGVATPITMAGAPVQSGGQQSPASAQAPSAQADPMDAFIAQANQAVQLGADPNKVQAWLQQQAQAAGMQPAAPPQANTASAAPASAQQPVAGATAPSAQPDPMSAPMPAQAVAAPQTLADYKLAHSGVRQLSADEIAAMGLPKGTVAQRKPDGSVSVISKAADNGDSGMELLTPNGKVLMDAAIAHGYNMPMPSMGYGKAGTAAKAAAINALADKFVAAGKSPDEAVSLMIQGKTATAGLQGVQKTYANISGWENSASKQADIALDMSNRVSRTGIPIFNSWLLAGRQGTGDVQVAQFNNTVNTLAEEYAKVMSGGGGNVAATDSSRALAHTMLNNAMTADQFSGVVAKMRQEMAARTQALQQTISTQRGSIVSNEGGDMGGWNGQTAPLPVPIDPHVEALLKKYPGGG